MKILFDTSVLLPSFRHPGLNKKLIGLVITSGHVPVLTDYILDELRINIAEKFTDPQKAVALDILLHIVSLGVVEVKRWEDYAHNLERARTLIRDKDAPVLAAIMLDDIDYFLTHDKRDFASNRALLQTRWGRKIKLPQDFLTEIDL